MNLSFLSGLNFIQRYPHFRSIILARFFSNLSARMLFTIMGWEVYSITKDPLSIGLIGLYEVIPAVSISLFAGNIIDLYSRKKIVTTVSACNVTLVFLLTASSVLFKDTPRVLVYLFYIYSFCIGVLRSFWGSSLSAMIPNIIPKNEIPTSAPFNTGAFLIGSITGHALGGFLIAHFSLHWSLACGVVLFFCSFLNVSRLPLFPIAMRVKASTFQNIKEGIQYVYTNKVILSALLLDLFAVLFGGVVALLPVYAKDILHISPSKFGWLNASMDVGAVIGILSFSLFPMKRRQGRKMIMAVGGFGICIILFSRSTYFEFSVLALMCCGFFDSISMLVRGIILQSQVPDYIRGRVMSVNTIFVSSSNELGQFESGLTSQLMGVVRAATFGGMMTLFVSIVVFAKSKKLRDLEWKSD